MKRASALFPAALLLVSSASPSLGQGIPTSQPNLIMIVREEVKNGHNAMHAAHEAGWPAAYARAKSPNYYFAMTSMTGPNEAWYIVPFASHAALAESMKRDDADATLSAELQRLSRGDADHTNSVRTIHAIARPDLSYGTYPDIALERFW